MKPAPFAYHAPATVEQALGLLDRHGIDAKVLAGGQSLMPLLNFRLARPEHVVDINDVRTLSDLRRQDGALHVGAMVRQSALERSPLVQRGWPILGEALRQLAHSQIRNRGTVGGSAAHADPSAELPSVFTALDARFHIRSLRRTRTVSCAEFFVTHLTTAIEPDELLIEIEVPAVAPRSGQAFVEFARRQGDFALGGAAVVLRLDDRDRCRAVAIALLGAAAVPIRCGAAEASLVGRAVDVGVAQETARLAVAEVQPTGDVHGSTDYRRQIIETLVRRALVLAASRVKPGRSSGDVLS